MTDQTIAGPGPDTYTAQDIEAAKRRELVQGCFQADNPALTKQLMLVHNVSVQEIQTAMDYKVDVINWMRMNGFPDGFQGLKVWPDAEIDAIIKWQTAQLNPVGPGTIGDLFAYQQIDPLTDKKHRAEMQDILDREHRRQQINPAVTLPWLT